MGVPSFYRWLVGKYPKVVVNAIGGGGGGGGDTSDPNPNGVEFDNLYLDMNGIIHPCFHPEDQLFPPRTFDEVFAAIFEYIDRILRVVRPRKLLYMAIDGVAPRAKMNQQRARRFKTAKDAEIAEAVEEKLRREFEEEGRAVLPREENEVSDSNVITPGTEFMAKLSAALEYYIRFKLNMDPGWRSIKVILSDANVPGEGEHKIMSFIRLQRNLNGYNPNTRHCLYGLDADLIMLALATHEAHFSILREDVLKQEQQVECVAAIESSISRRDYDTGKHNAWLAKVSTDKRGNGYPKNAYQFLHIWTLREYLELDMMLPDPPFLLDIERIIDDFIFICFLNGNDFLPHLPSLEMHEVSVDLLISVYKKAFKTMGGYIVDTSRIKERKHVYIKVKRVERFILEVGSYEDRIFEKRAALQQRKLQRWLRECSQEVAAEGGSVQENSAKGFCYALDQRTTHNKSSNFGGSKLTLSSFSEKCNITSQAVGHVEPNETFEESDVLKNTKELKLKLRNLLREDADLFKKGVFTDVIKLGTQGSKERYYMKKFSLGSSDEIEKLRKETVQKYMEGLCWVLQYYFSGVCSWNWYYPYHYGPFASDFRGLSCSQIAFKIGKPFNPFDQLLAVLPPRSVNALPMAYRQLMNTEDSVITSFYPTEFVVDTDGKRFLWQGVVKLPFIDEGLLMTATKMLEGQLQIEELERNSVKHDKIFVRDTHVLGSKIASIYTQKAEGDHLIDFASFEVNGFLSAYEGSFLSTSSVSGVDDIREDCSVLAIFKNPDFHDHIPRLPENVELPEKTITEGDIDERELWHEWKGPQPQFTSCFSHHKYLSRTGQASKPASATSAKEIWKGAGTGWSGAGRGRGHVQTVPPDEHHGKCQETLAGNTAWRRGSSSRTGYFVTPSQASSHARADTYTETRRSGERSSDGFWRSLNGLGADRYTWQERCSTTTAVDRSRGRGSSVAPAGRPCNGDNGRGFCGWGRGRGN